MARVPVTYDPRPVPPGESPGGEHLVARLEFAVRQATIPDDYCRVMPAYVPDDCGEWTVAR